MNYFQELLESYEKIKQRKFSLRIDEKGEFQELERHDPERAAAIEQKLMQEFDGYQGGTVDKGETFGIGNLPVTDVPEGATAGNMKLPAMNQAYAVTLTTTSLDQEAGTAVYFRGDGQGNNNQIMSAGGNINPRMFSAYKNALANLDAGIPTVGGEVDTAKLNAGNQVGSLATDKIKLSFKNLLDSIREAASASTAEGEAWVEKPASYVTGNQPQSLEKKFSKLRFVKLNPNSGRLEEAPMDDAVKSNMMETALKSIENLYSMGSGFDNKAAKLEACKNLSHSIRKDRGDKVVALTGEDDTEGIRWTPSPADKWFMSQAEKICDTEIERTPIGSVDQNTINDTVGKTSEMAAVVLAVLDALPEDADEETLAELAILTRKEVIKDVEQFRASFGRWIKELDSGSSDAEGAALAYVAEEVNSLIGGTEQELMSFFKRLGRLQAPLTKVMQADIVVNVGKDKGQGIKADTGFIYLGKDAKERASEAGKRLNIKITDKNKRTLRDLLEDAPSKKIWMKVHGLSDKDLDKEVYMIGDGLKTKAKKFTEMTLGETDLMLNVVDGDAKEIVEGYYDTVKSNLGFSNADVAEVRSYNSNMRLISTGIDTILPQGGLDVFDPDTGGTVISKGKVQIDTLRDKLRRTATFDDIQSGPLMRLFKDKKGRDLDLSDPTNMAKINEGLKRYVTFLRVTSDANDMKGNKLTGEALQARKWLAYTTNMVGGVDSEEAATVQDVENMETITAPHMGTMKEASKGVMNGSWEVSMPSPRGDNVHPGASILLTNSEDEEDKIALRQTRSWQGKKAATRLSVVQGRHSFKKRATISEQLSEPEKAGTEGLLFSYLDNQQKILESLVSLIKTS